MKQKFTLLILLITAFIFTIAAQSPNPIEIVDAVKGIQSWDDILNLQTVIYTAIITIGGYLSAFIPVLRNIDSGVYRVLTFAVITISAGSILGFSNIWVGAVAYFFSTSLYEVLLKWIFPSPKPDASN